MEEPAHHLGRGEPTPASNQAGDRSIAIRMLHVSIFSYRYDATKHRNRTNSLRLLSELIPDDHVAAACCPTVE
jgi:hypothetical protein